MKPLTLTQPQRLAITGAALLALFLGALDALVISAAMPTVIAELGGLSLYSWVYSAYFLARAVSLPIIGKLADLYPTRRLFLVSIGTFLLASIAAGSAWDMSGLIAARVVQGIGAGGVFALVYIVLADVAPSERRGKFLSIGSAVWGIASVLGPTLGGLIVTYLSWRWIFFINIPLALASLWGIGTYLIEIRPKKKDVSLDLWGASLLTTTILTFLFAFLMIGGTYRWSSPPIIAMFGLSLVSALVFLWIEHRTRDPILSIAFFANRGFATGNTAVFLSSFAIFSMFAFAPLFIQAAQGRRPMQVGMAMLSLSLGWSVGSLSLGRVVDRWGYKSSAVAGTVLLVGGCAMTLFFDLESTIAFMFTGFFIIGTGMGFVGLSTLLLVQASLTEEHLGVATSSNQLARTLGGTMGVGHLRQLYRVPIRRTGADGGKARHWGPAPAAVVVRRRHRPRRSVARPTGPGHDAPGTAADDPNRRRSRRPGDLPDGDRRRRSLPGRVPADARFQPGISGEASFFVR